MLSYLSPEQRVPQDHPSRTIRVLVDGPLRDLSPTFDAIYAQVGRPVDPAEAPSAALLGLILQTLERSIPLSRQDWPLHVRIDAGSRGTGHPIRRVLSPDW